MINLTLNLALFGSFDSLSVTSTACTTMLWLLLRVHEEDSILSTTWPYLYTLYLTVFPKAYPLFWCKVSNGFHKFSHRIYNCILVLISGRRKGRKHRHTGKRDWQEKTALEGTVCANMICGRISQLEWTGNEFKVNRLQIIVVAKKVSSGVTVHQ